MKLNFWHGDTPIHSVDIETPQEAPLPKIAFVGAVCFLLDEITVSPTGPAEAQYQKHDPMMLPPASPIIMPEKKIIQ